MIDSKKELFAFFTRTGIEQVKKFAGKYRLFDVKKFELGEVIETEVVMQMVEEGYFRLVKGYQNTYELSEKGSQELDKFGVDYEELFK